MNQFLGRSRETSRKTEYSHTAKQTGSTHGSKTDCLHSWIHNDSPTDFEFQSSKSLFSLQQPPTYHYFLPIKINLSQVRISGWALFCCSVEIAEITFPKDEENSRRLTVSESNFKMAPLQIIPLKEQCVTHFLLSKIIELEQKPNRLI